jgi:hypothetical protein
MNHFGVDDRNLDLLFTRYRRSLSRAGKLRCWSGWFTMKINATATWIFENF